MAFTVTQIVDNARDLYNGTSDSFFTDARIYEWMTNACNILAREGWLIETTSTTAAVSGTQSYAYPTNVIAIKRVTYNGGKLALMTMREDDAITLSNQETTATGTPVYYYDYNQTIYLRPIPDNTYTIKFWTYSEHAAIAVGTTLAIPNQFQLGLVDFILMNMYAKDKDFEASMMYEKRWQETIRSAVRFKQSKKRADKFAMVQSEELLPSTIIGAS